MLYREIIYYLDHAARGENCEACVVHSEKEYLQHIAKVVVRTIHS